MNEIPAWQLVALAVGSAAILWPRREAIGTAARQFLRGSVGTEPDANTIATAYRTLAPHLTAQTASDVRAQVADALLSQAASLNSDLPRNEEFDFSEAFRSILAAIASQAPAKSGVVSEEVKS